jgi:hypothetical protein
MTTKVGVYLTDDVAKLLKTAARRAGATKSDIVNEALRRLLDPKGDNDRDDEVIGRLKGLAQGNSTTASGCADRGGDPCAPHTTVLDDHAAAAQG